MIAQPKASHFAHGAYVEDKNGKPLAGILTEAGVPAGVFTNDLRRGHRVIAQLEAGSCFLNSCNDAPVEAPFGGVKQSGVGRENSKAAIEHYSQLKSVYVRMTALESPF